MNGSQVAFFFQSWLAPFFFFFFFLSLSFFFGGGKGGCFGLESHEFGEAQNRGHSILLLLQTLGIFEAGVLS